MMEMYGRGLCMDVWYIILKYCQYNTQLVPLVYFFPFNIECSKIYIASSSPYFLVILLK